MASRIKSMGKVKMIANVMHATALVAAWVQGAISGREREIQRSMLNKPAGFWRTHARGKQYSYKRTAESVEAVRRRRQWKRTADAQFADPAAFAEVTPLSFYTKDGKFKPTARRKLHGWSGKWWLWNNGIGYQARRINRKLAKA